jgi:hypothetical protein
MKWLRKFFSLCEHKWSTKQTINVFETDDDDKPRGLPSYTKYVLQCEHCGNIKTKTV